MTEVVPYTHRAPERSYAADWLRDPAELAQRIGGTDFVPDSLRNNPAAITAALLYGEEVGLAGPMTSLARIAVINGRPTLAAEAQRALILAAGHDLWVEELSTTRCTVAGRRRGSDQISRVTWTLDDATRANLATKPPWRMYPRQMLLARASAELARAVFPDAIGGLAATEELEDNPELAAVANGETAEPTTTRRRRRAPASSQPSAPPTADVPPGPAAPTTGGLPPEEQALVDQAKEEFDASERRDVPQGGPPADEPPAEPTTITDAQLRKLQAGLREKGIADRADKLAYVNGVIDRTVTSSRELTVAEASEVIDHLDKYDPDDPQTWPFPEGF